jgi:hypothetical protein
LDGTLGDPYSQLEQFSADALSAPQAIVQRHRLDQSNGFGRDSRLRRGRLRSLPPTPAERLTVPAEEGLGLDNQERLLPVPSSPRKQQQEEPVDLGTHWALHLTAKDNQLLTKQSVFGHEFSPSADQIVQCSHEVRAARWPRPLHYMLLDSIEEALESAVEHIEQRGHGSLGSVTNRDEVRDVWSELSCVDSTVTAGAMARRYRSRTGLAGYQC